MEQNWNAYTGMCWKSKPALTQKNNPVRPLRKRDYFLNLCIIVPIQ